MLPSLSLFPMDEPTAEQHEHGVKRRAKNSQLNEAYKHPVDQNVLARLTQSVADPAEAPVSSAATRLRKASAAPRRRPAKICGGRPRYDDLQEFDDERRTQRAGCANVYARHGLHSVMRAEPNGQKHRVGDDEILRLFANTEPDDRDRLSLSET